MEQSSASVKALKQLAGPHSAGGVLLSSRVGERGGGSGVAENEVGEKGKRGREGGRGSLLLGCAADVLCAVADSPPSPQIVLKSILDTFLCASFLELC